MDAVREAQEVGICIHIADSVYYSEKKKKKNWHNIVKQLCSDEKIK